MAAVAEEELLSEAARAAAGLGRNINTAPEEPVMNTPTDGAEEQAAAAAVAAEAPPSSRPPSFDTGRPPESTMGGETTCIICFTDPKSHIATPCGHVCACGRVYLYVFRCGGA
ncbi:hypothetical protein EMIHUDRAFT_243276 [Emiliania huxleyi CCMP1516]|uniref:RING-type domain-containing protein n=2 Tax=Emiliania huxleyi TaxID=2903 RepID=A0A0D3J6H1_EMIH1|nr:hypothetical protein EMIHUDRAFT_243276 [Emiliania huxleyi CCMP1516]EOD19106.1 hypothetical protein EMIHUDRAFT_243276 [Emiliania huxleyi CCMP1516]|eukprot:XP_005771535.1 hypothetical protein EMIHUDRAFT_243276 [Emiliania huxleyi CCMP1516]